MNKKQKTMLARIIAALIIYISLYVISKKFEINIWIELVLFLVPYAIAGYDIVIKSFKSIKSKELFDENQLMLVASVGAFATQECAEAVAVILFYQVGELFQSVAVERSRNSISDLMNICPEYANIEKDGEIITVDPDDVSVGDTIVIKAGEKVPLDCKVIKGSSNINTAALTGESAPVFVSEGSELLSGSINGDGVLYAEVLKEFEDSAVTKILELVENASEKKAHTENFITKFAKYYTPMVVIAALLLAVVPPIFVGNLAEWVKRACTFLVISCPCALVISIPMGFFGGIGGASRNGILIKGSFVIENLAQLKTAAFDKTGTITKGSFAVTDVLTGEGEDKDSVLLVAAAAECASTHPIAVSIRKACKEEPDASSVTDIKEIAGKGISAIFNNEQVFAGNRSLLIDNGIDAPENENSDCTVVYVAKSGKYLGSVLISDEIKETSPKAISELKKAGVKKTVMLTGDKKSVAEAIAKKAGIDEVHAGLLPENKVEEVEALLKSESAKEKLAFVGDGINDAPVLMRADVGVAMGAIGSDAAIEAADIVIVDDNLLKLPLAVKIAHKTMRIVKTNIVFALGVKAIVLVLGALGIASMWLAVFADVGVAIIAILNAMRALSTKNLK